MTLYCVDTSAWHHARHRSVADIWLRRLEQDRLCVCDQVRLEIRYSARSATDYDLLTEELGALHSIPIGAQTFNRALEVQGKLAQVGGLHHRSVKIAALVIAAAAEAAEATMLHYDADYERIAAVTGQPIEWIAPRGSL